ncbi:erythromycin esterase family protein [Micromonospora sp. NPDC018662]|uniref:erythromycin esterase family protein n=1 Tax=Micromonospora sp. NPDC018662 TaxID=3364238 RepID=UPI0037B9D328
MSEQPYHLEAAGRRISALVDDATIVGLGTATRAAHELFGLVEQTTHVLIRSGFRAVALVDNQRIGERYDGYVRGTEHDLDAALGQAWGPWRTTEMREALGRLRRRNQRHPADPVRVVAVGGARVLPADYDRAVGLVARLDATTAGRVKDLLDAVRVAHDNGEHVQRARGLHPGTPFVDLARSARDLVVGLDHGPVRDQALTLLDTIVAHHANAIDAGYDVAREERSAAERLVAYQRRTGDRVVLWEGSAHVAAHRGPMMGAHLRAALGDAYAAVHLTFGRGRIPGLDLPDPSPRSLEAGLLDGAGAGVPILDLRAPHPDDITPLLSRPSRTRLISGVYDPERDEEHYLDLPSPRDSFDVVAVLPTVSAVHPLPPAAGVDARA